MFVDDNYIKNYLNEKWNGYFRSSFYKNMDINNLPYEVYKDFLTFLKKNFKQDILFEYLYSEYIEYIKKISKNQPRQYLSKKGFEKNLLDIGLNTYVIMEDDYEVNKYVCFENKFK